MSLFSRTEGEPLDRGQERADAAEQYGYEAAVKNWRDPERQDKIRLAQVFATLALKDVVQELVTELRHRRNGG